MSQAEANASYFELVLNQRAQRDLKPDPVKCGLPAGTKLPKGGSLYVGETGTLVAKHGSSDLPILYPEESFADFRIPAIEKADHYKQTQR